LRTAVWTGDARDTLPTATSRECYDGGGPASEKAKL
jgi:hypothetical protein